jgi:hypothetical protein
MINGFYPIHLIISLIDVRNIPKKEKDNGTSYNGGADEGFIKKD